MKTTTTYFISKLSLIFAAILFFSISACQKDRCTKPETNTAAAALYADENGKIIPGQYIVKK